MKRIPSLIEWDVKEIFHQPKGVLNIKYVR